MSIGFTGTRFGMNEAQKDALRSVLLNPGHAVLHHGDCVGADAEAHEIAAELSYRIVVHPPSDPKLQADCYTPGITDVEEAKPYLERNQDIVDACDMLVAAPAHADPQRGGTWWTINYADRMNKLILILWRDGAIEEWNAEA